MAKPKPIDPKERALRAHGALHRPPVSDEGFVDNGFFDPRDVVKWPRKGLR
jgi:hypothetical protein